MGVRKKGRHKLDVEGRAFLWYVKQDCDSDAYILHVLSDDKRFVVLYKLQQQEPNRYLTVLGKEFGRVRGTGNCWRRFHCPAWENDGVITPSSVRRLIDWSQQTDVRTEEVDCAGLPLPLGGCCTSCANDLRGMVPIDSVSCPKCGHLIAERLELTGPALRSSQGEGAEAGAST
jgi:hypothetical protein